MANTFSVVPAPAGAVMPFPRQVGVVPFQLVTTNTYATATGGFAISLADLNVLLTAFGIEMQVKPSDILFITADANAAGAAYHAVFVRQSDFTYKVRVTNGITEIGDGALSLTVIGAMFFSPGSPS